MKTLTFVLMCLRKTWCLLVHSRYHEQYWTQVGKDFYRCRKCGGHFARKWE